jgi:hypothetical protein
MRQPELSNIREYTISIKRANKLALLFIFPIAILYVLPFYLLWGKNIFVSIKTISLAMALLSIPVGIMLHELLHGAVWAIFAAKGFRSIRFGIKWEYLTPYCHCLEPVKAWQYIAGGIAPVLIMGILPGVGALISGNTFIMFFAMFFTWAAGGDLQSVWMLRKFKIKQLVLDHPEELGFIVID